MQHLSLRALAALLVLGTAACTVNQDDGDDTQMHEVQGGTRDLTKHAFAVGIANKATKTGAVCSGTLIAPNLVLTARHCVVSPDGQEAVTCADSFAENTSPTNLFVTTEPSIHGAKNLYAVIGITTPGDKSFCGNDIALITLGQNIPSSEAQPAIPVVQFSIADHQRLSGQIAALGYGLTAPNAGDPGTRRVRQKIDILCVPGDASFDCRKTGYSAMMDNDREFITQGYVCSGDSGGGAFDQATFASTGTPYVLGALSRGPQNDTECLAAIYSRTDRHADLIIDTAKKAAAVGGYVAADWATGAPPPPAPAPKTQDTSDKQACVGEVCTTTDSTEPAPKAAPATATITRTTSGCSAAPGTTSRSSALGVLLAVATVLAARRRRR